MAESQDTTANLTAEEKFQLELRWCVQQLEHSLSSGKLSERNVKETSNNIKTLTNSKVQTVRKRQLMKLLFGDYRSKMREEEKKLGLVAKKVKFTETPEAPEKCRFLKKAAILTASGSNDFYFNFKIAEDDEPEKNVHLKNEFSPSDMTFPAVTKFRFNFDIEEEGDIDFSNLLIS